VRDQSGGVPLSHDAAQTEILYTTERLADPQTPARPLAFANPSLLTIGGQLPTRAEGERPKKPTLNGGEAGISSGATPPLRMIAPLTSCFCPASTEGAPPG